MTKSELKPGYIVRYKDGNLRMVMDMRNERVLVEMKGAIPFWNGLDDYTENLESKSYDNLTIVEVYGHSSYPSSVWHFDEKHRKLLWKRNEKKKYTYAQLREILGEEFEVVG